jgi:zinc/manganese transport system substrate-binding protein
MSQAGGGSTGRRRRTTQAAALLLALLLLPALPAAFAACGGQSQDQTSGRLDVVASTTFLADIAQNVAGSRFHVGSLIPVGADPHAFDPTPSDLRPVAGAQMLIVNGAGLEGPLLTTMKNVGSSATIVDASAGLKTRTPQPGEPPLAAGEADPHFWLDPVLVETYVANIRDAFIKADPSGAAVYKANAAAYIAKLKALDAWVKKQVATIPPQNRVLVTNHLSHGYFADRYGFRIVGAVIPDASTADTPTARQLTALTAAIRADRVKAIFVELGANPQLADQLAAETGVKVVSTLLDHSLSAPGGPAPTYIDMIRYDTRLIVQALK